MRTLESQWSYVLILSIVALFLTSCFIPKENTEDDLSQLLGTDSVVGSWNVSSGNDTIYYNLASDSTVQYCKLDSSSNKISYAESTWSDGTIQWTSTSSSSIGSSSGQLNELFEGSFTTYASTNWPNSCDDNVFADTWEYTSTDQSKSLYYKIATDNTTHFCNLTSSLKVSDVKGTLSGATIKWNDTLSSTLSFSNSKITEVFEGNITVYSRGTWPSSCDTDIFSTVWKSNTSTYEIKTDGSVNLCTVSSSGTATSTTGTFSDYTITWLDNSTSSVLVKDSKMIETYNNITSTYSKSSLPFSCP